MSILLTSDFIAEKVKLGNEPVFLVEIQSAGQFFATREPAFTGKWTAGDGLIAGSGIEANDDYPTYDTGLSQLLDEGIGSIAMTLDFQSGLALTGSTSVSILNQLLYSHITDDFDLTNARIRVRLGFFGQTFQDYISIFSGAIDDFQATLQTMELACIDDTVINLVPVPPQTGSDFLPQAFTVGQAIPIILGDVDLVPTYQLVDDVTDSLLTPMDASQVILNLTSASARFPRTGTVNIEGEVITYTGVQLVIIGQQQSLQLTGLTRGVAAAHPAGAIVTLVSFQYEFLLGFEVRDVRRIRKANGVAPTTPVSVVSRALDPVGNDPRRITVFTTDTEDTDLTATVGGFGRAPNLIVNGEGDTNPVALGWTVGNGAWGTAVVLGEDAIRGTVSVSQVVDSELFQDITTVTGDRYRLTASISLDSGSPPPFATIRVGTPSDVTAVFDFGQITNTFETGVDLTFIAPAGGTTRITLVVNSDTPGVAEHAYFDHIMLYAVESENPADQLQRLVELHAGNQQITVDPVSFATARTEFLDLGDRLAGVIDQTQEIQGQLGRIAFQYRSKTFLDESGRQKIVIFNNSAPPVAEIDESDVDKGTFTVRLEPEEKLASRFYVYFNRRADLSTGSGLGGRDAYQNVLFATPEETNSVNDGALQVLCQQVRQNFRIDRPMEIFADMIPDASTADRLLSHICRLHTHRRYLAQFTTYLNNIELEIADVVRIRHELLPPSANNVTFEVIEKEIHPNGCLVSYTCAEIRQSQYNTFIEKWEAPFARTPSAIQIEFWEQPPPTFLKVIGEDGEKIVCNPWIETWEPTVAIRDERFEYVFDPGEIGNAPESLSRSLIAAFDDYFPSGGTENAIDIVHPTSLVLPPTGKLGNSSSFRFSGTPDNQRGSSRMFMQEPSDYQIDTGVLAHQHPEVIVQGSGPATAMQFVANDDAGIPNGQRIRMSSLFHWLQTDFTLNFWVYQSIKGSNHRTLVGSRSHRIISGESRDDSIAFMMWWDFTDDRWHLVMDYFVDEGVDVTPDYNAHVALLRAHTEHLTHASLGAPALNTWYMVTLRWDLSTLTMDWTINGDFTTLQETHVLGGTPGIDTYFRENQLFWMRDDTPRTYRGMNGRLAQMHGWGRRLTDAELTDLYNTGDTLPYPYQ